MYIYCTPKVADDTSSEKINHKLDDWKIIEHEVCSFLFFFLIIY